jgi:hypothetical protein
LFLLFTTIATPLLNSGDDTFFMYTLGGGYGEAPSNLTQYNYGWNFILGAMVQRLFTLAPGINWYTIVLLFFHMAGCTAFLYVLFKRTKFLPALLLFFISFFFIETRQLLTLTYSGASFIAGAGAVFLCIHQLQQRKVFNISMVFALLLLVLAGMLRVQIIWLVIALFGTVAITLLAKQQLLRWVFAMLMAAGVLWGLNKLHEQYFINNVAGWQQQEKLRQALFYSYNRQLVSEIPEATFKDSTEQALFFAGFLYDSVNFNTERIIAIGKQITRNRGLASKQDRVSLYWFFIEMRVYILLFVLMTGYLLIHRKYGWVRRWLLSLLAYLAVHLYLFLFLKMTMPIHFGLLFFLWMSMTIHFTKQEHLIIQNKKLSVPLTIVLLLLGWVGVRFIKENNLNRERHQRFLCVMSELNSHPDKLFVATDDTFPVNYFYIWNTPGQYPAANILYKDRLITHTYLQTLKKYGITNLDEAMLHNEKVLLVGSILPALENVKQAKLSDPLPPFRCLQVRRLMRPE